MFHFLLLLLFFSADTAHEIPIGKTPVTRSEIWNYNGFYVKLISSDKQEENLGLMTSDLKVNC